MIHNITTLTDQIYDKLANNTEHDQFNVNDYDLKDMFVDTTRGVITIEYEDKTFEIVVREA